MDERDRQRLIVISDKYDVFSFRLVHALLKRFFRADTELISRSHESDQGYKRNIICHFTFKRIFYFCHNKTYINKTFLQSAFIIRYSCYTFSFYYKSKSKLYYNFQLYLNIHIYTRVYISNIKILII